MALKRSKEEVSVWDLVASGKARPDHSKDVKRLELLRWWGQDPLNFILGEDLEEREIVPGSGIYSNKLVWTSDEKDDLAPLKPFPEWEYIQRYITILHLEREVVSDKARQMFSSTSCGIASSSSIDGGSGRRPRKMRASRTSSRR
jgi:hypothetical protein